MSKLDDIFEWDSLASLHHETKALAKDKIKNLSLELCKEMEVPSGYADEKEMWQAMGYNRAVREIRQEIENL